MRRYVSTLRPRRRREGECVLVLRCYLRLLLVSGGSEDEVPFGQSVKRAN